MKEPSVLDYLKSRLMPWKKPRITLRGYLSDEVPPEASPDLLRQGLPETQVHATPKPGVGPATIARPIRWPWRALVALLLALLAQILLEPRAVRVFWPSVFLYLLAAGWLVWAYRQGEIKLFAWKESSLTADPFTVRWVPFLVACIMVPLSFLAFSSNHFTFLNLLVWIITIAATMSAFWLGPAPFSGWLSRINEFRRNPEVKFRLSREFLIGIIVVACILFFRLYQLNRVPLEMTSDHAEKLLDIWDVLHGRLSIFFIRNTGREPMQFYLTALIIKLFGTGISFLSLKLGTTLAGLVTLVYIYRLGKELGSREIGMLAALLAGIAYWPNLITRIALRFTFYPAFVAITLYYLLRALRTSRRNDFILVGLALGLSLHTYTPARALVLVVLAAFGLHLLYQKGKQARLQSLLWLGIVAFISFVIFLPLLRFASQYPSIFFYRTLTRVGDLEHTLPGPAWLIFLKNLWNAAVMFFWDNGEVWTISIPHRPALDFVSAALFFLGICLLVIRLLRRRNWVEPFLLLSIPLLMLPSILALAFPNENPALNRTGGALVPVFLIIGMALQGLLAALRDFLEGRAGLRLAWGAGITLVLIAALQNYALVFSQYSKLYDVSSWNTSEVGQVIRGFADSVGSLDSAWVIPYPYWMDTRLVGMNAGFPTKDYALQPDQIDATTGDPRAKLFIFKEEDQQTFDRLTTLYPQGRLKIYPSRIPTKEFWVFTVLPQQNPGFSPAP